MKRNLVAAVVLACASVMTAGVAQATVINANIIAVNGPMGLGTGVSVDGLAPSPFLNAGLTDVEFEGEVVNEVNNVPNFANLQDSEGFDTGISVEFITGGGSGFTFSELPGDQANPVLTNFLSSNVNFGAPVPPATIAFSGLNPSLIYDFFFISQGDNPTATQGGDFTINGVTQTSLGDAVGDPAFIEGSNFVVFEGIIPDADGTLDVTFETATGGSAAFAVLNGFQIVAIPEPTTTALAMLGMLAGAGFTSRRRN